MRRNVYSSSSGGCIVHEFISEYLSVNSLRPVSACFVDLKVGSIIINLGMNLLKLGHLRRAAAAADPGAAAAAPPVSSFWPWQLGAALFAVGNLLNFVSFGFAAQSLLAALGSVQFVTNVIFAHYLLHERASDRVVLATGIVMSGCIILVCFGDHQSKVLTVDDMIGLYRSPVYLCYLLFLGAGLAAFFGLYQHSKQALERRGLEGMSGRWTKMLPLSYATFSGMLGTQTVVFCKTLSLLIRSAAQGRAPLPSTFFGATFSLFVITAYFWVSRLNKALQLFPAMVIVPSMQLSWTLFSIVSGMAYFQEYRAFTPLSASMFTLGVLVVLLGVYLLAPGKRAYLQSLKDTEELLSAHRRSFSRDADVEAAGHLLALRHDVEIKDVEAAGKPRGHK